MCGPIHADAVRGAMQRFRGAWSGHAVRLCRGGGGGGGGDREVPWEMGDRGEGCVTPVVHDELLSGH